MWTALLGNSIGTTGMTTMRQAPRGPTAIRMPADFPTGEYRAVYDRVIARATTDKYPDEWAQQFIGAALAIAYRFRACARHDAAFTRSVLIAGRTPDEYDRYAQDQELFNFFVTGFASLESLYFYLHAIGARLAPSDFPFLSDSDYRKVDLQRTVDRFKRAFPGTLCDELLRAYTSQERQDWEYARNVLIHRVASGGRVIYLWTQPPTEPDAIRVGTHRVPITSHATKSRRAWLAASLKDILAQAHVFVNQYF